MVACAHPWNRKLLHAVNLSFVHVERNANKSNAAFVKVFKLFSGVENTKKNPNFRLQYNTILERHSPAQIARIPNGLCNKSIHFDLGCDGTDLPHLIMQECSNQNWRTFKFFIDDPRTAGCNFCQDGVGTAGQLPGLDLATKPLSCFSVVEGGTWKISTKRKWNLTTHQWPLSHVSCEFDIQTISSTLSLCKRLACEVSQFPVRQVPWNNSCKELLRNNSCKKNSCVTTPVEERVKEIVPFFV